MAKSKKSARSSRGRSTYAKTMQRSQPKQKRLRRKEEEEAPVSRNKSMLSPAATGALYGATAGVFIGAVLHNVIIGALLGGIVGALGGWIRNVVDKRAKDKKKNTK